MSDEEDDYFSDKFLIPEAPASRSAGPKTYSQRRRDAQLKQAEASRIKSRREREEEARRMGLETSLIERAMQGKAGKDDNGSGNGVGNGKKEADNGGGEGEGEGSKALSMMMKMGFKPGQALGAPAAAEKKVESVDEGEGGESRGRKEKGHITEPLPLQEWMGRKGIGVLKRPRALSPSEIERLAKVARTKEDDTRANFRERYEDRRTEGQLASASRTCVTLDERAGVQFNVLTLDPTDPETIPNALIEALEEWFLTHTVSPSAAPGLAAVPDAERLRKQMEADALAPLDENHGLDDGLDAEDDGDDGQGGIAARGVLKGDAQVAHEEKKEAEKEAGEVFSQETVAQAAHFLGLGPRDRLRELLAYLRDRYSYCLWCGTEYDGSEDLAANCPGPTEEEHD
ncbi:hypothetical protein CONPUDRAFT_136758 [Coniophora puteana RWD-64-598 SS2]|uniref:DUF4187 domain-containing protein n=1 Tax=Coniophora puteana (strain RWD-64-598) TaxID=741705 RepID=A0A5M3MST5_CONPW|nr:uncharacterized protein CONPUDRAFT_136758 [Coniophora puteana RWD-64-598 SS2]EIW82229.1 hypothetical protein CONPUDRAFT_136758 [Coniophora puteana RWD-64-598 SS2]